MSNPDLGWVYLLKAKGMNRYKIGITTQDLDERVYQLSNASPVEIQQQYAVRIRGYRDFERRLHNRYSTHQVDSEWFEFDDPTRVIADMKDRLRWGQFRDPIEELNGFRSPPPLSDLKSI